GITESGNTVLVTTTAAHGLVAGSVFTMADASVAGYNGTYVVTSAPTTTTFTYTNPATLTTPAGGGTVTRGGASESGTTVTITTAAPHGFVAGQTVTISGLTGAATAYNGTFTILASPAPTSTTFAYTNSTVGLLPSGGGTVTLNAASVDTAANNGATQNGNL